MRTFEKELEASLYYCMIERARKSGLRVRAPSYPDGPWDIKKRASCPYCTDDLLLHPKILELFGSMTIRGVCNNGLCGWCEDSDEWM
jgi:hypothetical protein